MKYFILGLSLLVLTACSKSDTVNNCNFLLNLNVNYTIDLNLPQFGQLQFTSNSVYILDNQSNGGLIVTNVGSSLRAWDASDPNHTPSACSIMSINGANAECGCTDANEYSLFTGQILNGSAPCGLKEYRVEPLGNNTYLITN